MALNLVDGPSFPVRHVIELLLVGIKERENRAVIDAVLPGDFQIRI